MACADSNAEGSALLNGPLGQPSGAVRLPPSRIAMVVRNLSGGGLERVALHVSRGLLERGYHVDMVVFGEGNDYPDEMPDGMRRVVLNSPKTLAVGKTQKHATRTIFAGYMHAFKLLNWQIALFPPLKTVRMAVRLARYVELSKPNYIISHAPREAMLAQMASSMAAQPVPVLSVIHNVLLEIPNIRRRKRFCCVLGHVQKVIAVSSAVKKAVERQAKISHPQIEVIHNGVPAGSIELLSRDRPDHKWFKESGIPVVLGIGRLVPQKDFPTLMRAFCLLRKRMKCRLVILGKGAGKKRLDDLSHQLGIAEDFDNPGFTDSPYRYMRHSSALGLSSKFEGLGMVLLEALACGCPCVSTDSGGPRDILADGCYGALVPVGDHEAMADALERAIRTPPPKDLLRRRAEEFSVERCVSGYERVLAAAAQETAAGQRQAPAVAEAAVTEAGQDGYRGP